MIPYIRRWQDLGWHPRAILRHMLGLFAFQPGARRFRQKLSGPMADDVDGAALLVEAIAQVPDRILVA
jgi:tRNA-dihydrouridine synthase A